MTFKIISSNHDPAEYLAREIKKHLDEGQRVLWLVPGGSSISIAAQAAAKLAGSDLTHLALSLTDERYGPMGHPDSNWQQLADAGFKLVGARLHPVLDGQGASKTAKNFSDYLHEVLSKAAYRIGFFGMGPDGHTAGILPGSPAVTSTDFAAAYKTPEFTRITMTPAAIARLDEAVVYATGESKHRPLSDLEKDLPLTEQPAQALKKAGKLIVYNDYKGDA